MLLDYHKVQEKLREIIHPNSWNNVTGINVKTLSFLWQCHKENVPWQLLYEPQILISGENLRQEEWEDFGEVASYMC